MISRASDELHRVLQDELRLTPKQLLEDQNLALGVFLGEMDRRSALHDALFNWKDGDERLYHY